MARAPRSVAKRARHKKWLKRAKGFRGRRRTVFKLAKEAVLKAGQYAYRDRRKRKSALRARWQVQINAAARQHNTTYSRFIRDLKENNSTLNRKVLATLATKHPDTFARLVEKVSLRGLKSVASRGGQPSPGLRPPSETPRLLAGKPHRLVHPSLREGGRPDADHSSPH